MDNNIELVGGARRQMTKAPYCTPRNVINPEIEKGFLNHSISIESSSYSSPSHSTPDHLSINLADRNRLNTPNHESTPLMNPSDAFHLALPKGVTPTSETHQKSTLIEIIRGFDSTDYCIIATIIIFSILAISIVLFLVYYR